MADSKFSVLMSVYQREDPSFFDLSLDSILVRQTLSPDELVLVCDGELNEGLEAVINKYRSMFPEVFKVYRKENGGLGKALNFGLPLCSFDLVARADSDDICVPERFEKQVRYMDEHPEVGIISSYVDEFQTDPEHPSTVKMVPLTHEEIFQMAKFRNPMCHMAAMMRKDQVLRVGGYQSFLYMEDYELWVRSMMKGIRLGNIGEILVHARVGNGMVQRRGNRPYLTSFKAMNKNMLKGGMIGPLTYVRNLTAATCFVYMPPEIKEFLYRKFLRKER